MTAASLEKKRIIVLGISSVINASTSITAAARRSPDFTEWRTRSAFRPPKFCPTTGDAAKLSATTGRKSACITRAPTPNPACAAGPKFRMIKYTIMI